MSSCIVLQQKNNIFIASDKAVSSNVNGGSIRVSNHAEKIFHKENSIIFCSGNMDFANKCKNYIKQMNTINVDEIQDFVSHFYVDGMFEIFIANINENSVIETFQLSSYNDFKQIKRIVNENDTEIFALGYNTKKMLNNFEKNLFSTNIIDAIKNTFNENICVEVGGIVDIMYFYKGRRYSQSHILNDNTECLLSEVESKYCNFVIAETLVGKLILSEKMHIGNEDNTFTILPDGLRIYDNNASHELRVFLGIDEKTNKATMQLYSANGEKSLVLSEEGIYNCYQISDRDSFDYYNPFETNFYIPYTLNSTFEARIIVDLQKFRAYSKSANSTKIDLTTTSGSGNINVNINGVSGGAGGVGVSSSGTSVAWGHGGKHTSKAYGNDEGGGNVHLETHTHWVELLHDHSVTVNSSPHSHPITLSGTASANDHSHGITMPSHGHDLVYGIYETDYFPTCEVWIGDHLVATLNDGTRRVDIDITKQFKLLSKGSNKITIKTPNGNELGRASFTLFWSGFYTYY